MAQIFTRIRRTVCTLTALSLMVPFPVLADGTYSDSPAADSTDSNSGFPRTSAVRDVRLTEGDAATFTVLDAQGRPQVGAEVLVKYRDAVIARAISDQAGRVVVSGLRPGVHVVSAPMGSAALRFWDSRTAPPAAVGNAVVVSDAEVVRGQYGSMGIGPFIGTALTIGALAVAIDAHGDADDASDLASALQARVTALETASP